MRRLQSNYRSSDLFQAKALLILFCLLGVVFSVRAQEVNLKVTDRLTDAEVQAAITNGLHEKPWEIGLSMQQHHFMGLFFSITVYWPGAWIEYLAFEAHRQLKPFTAADVTDAMRARVIVVQANPSVPTEMQLTKSEVERVARSLNCFGMRLARSRFLKGNDLDRIRESWSDLIHGSGDVKFRMNKCNSALFGFGKSAIQETLGYYYPKKYPLRNANTNAGLRFLGYNVK